MAEATTSTRVGGPRRIASWTLEEIAGAIGAELVGPSAGEVCPTSVSSDTRSLEGGELFVALRGDNFDAHAFVGQAEEAGAVAAIVDDPDCVDADLPMLVVEDTLDGLTALGRAVWQDASSEGLHTINVTGSNGKTTVKEMLALLWSAHGEVFATPGNLNNHIGVPLVLCDIPAGCEHLILELGANAQGEISELVALAPGSERLITSIGVAHIEGFGSVDGIRRAKAEIFEGADEDTTAVVPAAEVDRLISGEFPGRVLTVEFDEDADLRVELLEPAPPEEALRARIMHAGQSYTLGLPIPGAHNAVNAATALATLIAAGKTPDDAACRRRLAQLSLPQGRWRVVDVGDFRFVDDAYNANPSSVEASFDAFMRTTDDQNRARVAVIGEMLELGEGAEQWHGSVAETVAARPGLDAFVAVGPFADAMAEAARAADRGLEVVGVPDAQRAADWLAGRGPSFVFLKASRGARLERLIDLVGASGEKHD